MLVEELYYLNNKGKWDFGFIRIDSNGFLYKVKETALLYMKNGKFNLKTAAPYAIDGAANAYNYNLPELEPWMDLNGLLYLPDSKSTKKDVWLYFTSPEQKEFWFNKIRSYI